MKPGLRGCISIGNSCDWNTTTTRCCIVRRGLSPWNMLGSALVSRINLQPPHLNSRPTRNHNPLRLSPLEVPMAFKNSDRKPKPPHRAAKYYPPFVRPTQRTTASPANRLPHQPSLSMWLSVPEAPPSPTRPSTQT